jgi:hypothetical protein
MPRFVLLYHRCPPGYVRPSHWDLMLESGDMLRTWALSKLPQDWHAAQSQTFRKDNCPPLATENEVDALQLADHRTTYLDYEGALSDDRGSVFRIAEGTYELLRGSANNITCKVQGNLLEGTFTLSRQDDNADRWTLACHGFNIAAD